MGESPPEDSSWVKLGDSYLAVGFLAKSRFSTVHCRNSLKVDSALPLTLAMLGAIAQKSNLPKSFTVSLGIVLPFSEFRDREKFHTILADALQEFTYRGKNYHIQLKKFVALPEGGGLLARGRVPKRGQLLVPAYQLNLGVLMLGYRNASLLVMERGQLTKGLTSDLGFSQMIIRLQEFTSGQTESGLLKAICSAREVNERVLESLARSNRAELRALEIVELKQALADAKEEYLALLQNWIEQQIPSRITLDEILIGGGTARYLKPELTESLKGYGAQLNWGQSLEKRVKQAFAEEVRHHSLAMRLADVYGLFYKLLEKPLPKLKEMSYSVRTTRKEEKSEYQLPVSIVPQ